MSELQIFDRSGALPGPSWRDLMGEGRAVLRARLRRFRADVGGVPRGDGHPVIVLPAFFCSDGMTRGFRQWLTALGYAAEGWGSGVNLGPTAAAVRAVERQLLESTEEAGEKASFVGVSLGGVLARALTNAHPDRVRRVITVCSPFRLPTAKSARADLSGVGAPAQRPAFADRPTHRAAAGADDCDLQSARRRRRLAQLHRRARAKPRKHRHRRRAHDDARPSARAADHRRAAGAALTIPSARD